MKYLSIIIISLSILFAIAFWFADSVYEYYMFQKNLEFMLYQEPLSFWDSLINNVPLHALFNRLSFFMACLLAGIISVILLARWLESETRYQVLSDNFPNGALFLFDQHFRFLVAGGKAIEQMGLSSSLIKGKTIQETLPDLWKEMRSHCEEALNGQDGYFELDHADRSYALTTIPVAGMQASMQASKHQGILVIQDITERRLAEKEKEKLQSRLQQAQKMEAIGNLAGGVAHDYNNISSIIIGYTELAMQDVNESDPLYSDLREILSAAKRSTNITRQLLAFARQQTVAPKVIDINDMIAGMLKMLQRLIGEDIDLAWRPGKNVWSIKIDPSQIDQVLANLCVNARDAISDVGKVTIETNNVNIDEDYCADHPGFFPGDFVSMTVSDDGIGIAPDVLNKIFDPFFTTKKIGKGTGLGLATVYGIVKQNNGFINVYSEPEKGTSVKVYFPRHAGCLVEAHLENTLEAPRGNKEKILIVEDDGSILKLGIKILDDLDYSVISASTPGEAIQLAEKQNDKIDLLVTDVVMPEMNGRELSDRLKTLHPDIRTLYMSGYTANVIAHRGVLEEGICFIPKPFSKKELAVKVREALHNNPGKAL